MNSIGDFIEDRLYGRGGLFRPKDIVGLLSRVLKYVYYYWLISMSIILPIIILSPYLFTSTPASVEDEDED